MTPDEKIDFFTKLVADTIRKFQMLETRRIDTIPTLRAKWILVEKTMKVIDQKVAAVGALINAHDSLAAERSLDRAVKAAELLNLELDELLVATEPQK